MQGETVRIEFVSADATTAAEITLWNPDGTARLLKSNERVVIYDLVVSAASGAGTVTMFSDDDDDNTVDDGERMFAAVGAADIAISYGLDGQPGALGIMPHVIATGAGAVVITGRAGVQAS